MTVTQPQAMAVMTHVKKKMDGTASMETQPMLIAAMTNVVMV